MSILPLTLEGAEARRRGRTLVGPVDWRLEGAGLTMVMGPNGAGKSTLLRLMHGLERCAAGRAFWAAPEKEAREAQAFVFQTPILMRRSALDNIAYPLQLRGMSRARARARAEIWGEKVGIAHVLSHPAPSLSGGERQKMALARALIAAPEVLFLDEPCAALDGRATREIEGILRDARDGGARIVMSTHDFGQARRLADEVLFLNHGRVRESGPGPAFLRAPRTAEARAFLNGDILE